MPAVRGQSIEVLFSAEAIARRNRELAKEIASREFHDLLVISVLKGSFIFAADLIRALHGAGLAPEVEFILISSYGAGTASGEVKVLRDIDSPAGGRDVLLIDGILESGKTLKFTRDLIQSRGAKSVSIAVLLDKRKRRQTDLEADFVGFECPDRFVFGYGMDLAHAFRARRKPPRQSVNQEAGGLKGRTRPSPMRRRPSRLLQKRSTLALRENYGFNRPDVARIKADLASHLDTLCFTEDVNALRKRLLHIFAGRMVELAEPGLVWVNLDNLAAIVRH